MLANTWKGRSLYGWMLIGLCTSLVGVLFLCALPKLIRPMADRLPVTADFGRRRGR